MPEESNLKGVKENVAVPTKTPWYQNTNTLNTLNGVFLFGTHVLGTPKEYDGPKGEITQVSNAVYDLAADVVGLFNPLAGTIMKGGALLAGITNKLGGGTDGMTSLDAFLGSTLGQLSGLGIVNGAFGKKSDTFKANDYVIAQSRSSYGNTFDVFNNAAKKSGKKYGLTSSKDRKAANAEIAQAGRQLTQLKYLINDRDMAQESMAGSIDLYNLGYMNELMRAKTGTKFPNKKQINKAKMMARKYQLGNKIYETPSKLLTSFDVDKMVEDADKLVPTFKFDISMFLHGDTFTLYKKGGKLTATPNIIPEGALHARLHHLEDENPELKGEITTKGIPVVSKEDGGIVQLAEIERNEIILNKELTDKIEKFYKEYNDSTDDKKKDELAIEVGKILTCEILNNTIDKTGLLNEEVNL